VISSSRSPPCRQEASNPFLPPMRGRCALTSAPIRAPSAWQWSMLLCPTTRPSPAPSKKSFPAAASSSCRALTGPKTSYPCCSTAYAGYRPMRTAKFRQTAMERLRLSSMSPGT
jgi:hypothetical protein